MTEWESVFVFKSALVGGNADCCAEVTPSVDCLQKVFFVLHALSEDSCLACLENVARWGNLLVPCGVPTYRI